REAEAPMKSPVPNERAERIPTAIPTAGMGTPKPGSERDGRMPAGRPASVTLAQPDERDRAGESDGRIVPVHTGIEGRTLIAVPVTSCRYRRRTTTVSATVNPAPTPAPAMSRRRLA